MYIYCPGGDVAHWRQELDGTLPPAGVGRDATAARRRGAAMHEKAGRLIGARARDGDARIRSSKACSASIHSLHMTTHKVGIIMNGVTGRMGTNQHLLRSIKAIIDQGGVKLGDNEVIMPDPVLVGRSEDEARGARRAARTCNALHHQPRRRARRSERTRSTSTPR